MKIVRYVIIITLLCYSQLALSGNDLVEAIIEQNKPWLAEQLQQLNYIEVGNPIVYELVDYFCSITNNFFNDLMDQGKEISTDLFQTQVSIAMQKIVNATVHTHVSAKESLKLKIENDVTTCILKNMIIMYDGLPYDAAINNFPNDNNSHKMAN